MMRVGRHLFLAAALMGVACNHPDATPASVAEPVTEKRADRLLNGTNSDASQDSTVMLRIDTGGGEINIGSGVLIAPNLLLAALHTVAEVKTAFDTFPCVPGKVVLDVYSIRDVSTIRVYPGSIRPGPNTKPPVATKKVFPMPVADLCRGDIAVVQLESDLPGALISPMRFEDNVKVGDTFYAVGWGIMDTFRLYPVQRQTLSGVKVLALGPGSYQSPTGLTTYELYDGHMVVTSGVCFGDSGSGLFDPVTNAVVATVSGGQNDDPAKAATPTEPTKFCDGATIFYTRLTPFKDTILAAFKEAGHSPWIEGQPRPAAFGETCGSSSACDSQQCIQGVCSRSCATEACPENFECLDQGSDKLCSPLSRGTAGADGGTAASQGASCEQPSDCQSGLCAEFASQKVCTESCETKACEGGWQCGSLGTAKVCIPPAAPSDDGGCRLSTPGTSRAGGWAVGLLGLLGLAAMARRQRR